MGSRGHAPRYARSKQSPCRHKLVDLMGVEPMCSVTFPTIFYKLSAAIIMLAAAQKLLHDFWYCVLSVTIPPIDNLANDDQIVSENRYMIDRSLSCCE